MSGDSLIVCPKVSLNDIFYVSHPEKNYAYRNRIDRKHVDFLLLKAATLEPILAVELDDSSHKQPERVKRDELVDRVFSAAGLPLVRIPVRRSYDTRELAETFKKVMSSSTTS
jgi:very-short-patch-repair endonuclease